jgi:hypothetical protein
MQIKKQVIGKYSYDVVPFDPPSSSSSIMQAAGSVLLRSSHHSFLPMITIV